MGRGVSAVAALVLLAGCQAGGGEAGPAPGGPASGWKSHPAIETTVSRSQSAPPAPEPSAEVRMLREQIELLREERDWLRRRIEQLELRGEREQMLLLSEKDTVRRLVDGTVSRRWSLPFRLPWNVSPLNQR